MSNRKAIYYWKCDRPSAFGTLTHAWLEPDAIRTIEISLTQQLQKHFKNRVFTLKPGEGQGNHLTFRAESDDEIYFIRIENGPEKDNYMDVEAYVMDRVRSAGVPTPNVYAVDSSRKEVPYAYQILEYHRYPDLNHWYKNGSLDPVHHAAVIGRNIAKWQSIRPEYFGPFDPRALKESGALKGFHRSYPDYFFLNLDKHIGYLSENGILTGEESAEILATIKANRHLLELDHGCLVHKDLALWNVLGDQNEIKAFIDWDDTISGDPTDDLSLLACFHSEEVLHAAISGYAEIRPLPENFFPRFWLHLLRNMIVKAVIRVGGGYFSKHDDFFLIGASLSGSSLKQFTQERIRTACSALKSRLTIGNL